MLHCIAVIRVPPSEEPGFFETHADSCALCHHGCMTYAANDKAIRYRVGIDVGLRSIGFCAVEVDDEDHPIRILNSVVHVHDAGTGGPGETESLRKRSGVAARARRRGRAEKQRLKKLDVLLEELGWGVSSNELLDSHAPWHIRKRLVSEYIEDETERRQCLSVAMAHIARHRGWRNSFSKVDTLLLEQAPSDRMQGLKERVEDRTGLQFSEEVTQGELVATLLEHDGDVTIRGFVRKGGKATKVHGVLEGKYMQSDLVAELRQICRTQRVSETTFEKLVLSIFHSKQPAPSAARQRERVGLDELQLALDPAAKQPRAERAHPAFQKFKVVATLANMRIREQSAGERSLTSEELNRVARYLLNHTESESPTWDDVARKLEVPRHRLRGSSRASLETGGGLTYPPVDDTTVRVMSAEVDWLADWWDCANDESRGHMIDAISNGCGSEPDDVEDEEVNELISSATAEDMLKLELLAKKLPSGRVAYSLKTLREVTAAILETGDDLSQAITRLYGVDPGWVPTPAPIEAPVGNPSVDRVLKQVARWLKFASKRWGVPQTVNIEHTREGLKSASLLEEERERWERFEARREIRQKEMYKRLGISGPFRRSDQVRYEILDLQDCACLYCGNEINFQTFEVDHITPRVDASSDSRRTNLAAVCHSCNSAKGGLAFGQWVKRGDCPSGVSLENAIKRVRSWSKDRLGLTEKAMGKRKSEVISRLKTEMPYEEFDGRSMESVAWMAIELKKRIEGYFNSDRPEGCAAVQVNAYSGRLTACARRAAHVDKRVRLIRLKGDDGHHKNRFDRRNHAMDALVIALMTPAIARTIAVREDRREAQQLTRAFESWKNFLGSEERMQDRWESWIGDVEYACDRLNELIDADKIPVTENLRLRNSGKLHADQPESLKKARRGSKRPRPQRYVLGDALPADVINRVTDPGLWTALVRAPGFDSQLGLPADLNRGLKLRGKRISADFPIDYFPTDSPALAVQGGYVGLEFHHARLYRIIGPKEKVKYALLRVCAIDLCGIDCDDLFEVELKPSSISMRTADAKLKEAMGNGSAKQIGWLVLGDEIQIDPTKFPKQSIGKFLKECGPVSSWRVSALDTPSKITLKPRLLSNEPLLKTSRVGGHESDLVVAECVEKIMKKTGWVVEINALCQSGLIRVIRRNALGEVRTSPKSGLPISLNLR